MKNKIWSKTNCKGIFAIPLLGVPTVHVLICKINCDERWTVTLYSMRTVTMKEIAISENTKVIRAATMR